MKKLLVILGIINFVSCSIPVITTATSSVNIKKNWSFLTNKTSKTQNDIIQEEFELNTPITKAAGFYWSYSDENTLTWTKKLPTAKKYKNFILTGANEHSEGWAEGSSFKTQINKPWVNLILFDDSGKSLPGILLVDGIELNNKDIGGTWYTNDKKTYATAYGELFLDFKFFDNTINVKITAKATAFNPTFLGWTKTQTKFKFKIIIS